MIHQQSSHPKSLTLLAIAALWNLNCDFALAAPNPKQVIQYLNPIHEKSYQNESQDRAIKKKSFKSQEIEGVKAIANPEIGLFAILDNDKLNDSAYVDSLLKDESINGLSCLIAWKELEASEDVYNWKVLDDLLAKCASSRKLLIFRVSTCGIDTGVGGKNSSDTPHWVFDSGAKSLPYEGVDGKEHLMPIFWDGTYLAKWSNFIRSLGERYDKNAGIHSIGITGGGTLGSTNVVPDFTANKGNYDTLAAKLKSDFGMCPRQLVEHWKYVSDIFPKAFPTARLNFDIDPPTPNRAGQDTLDEISDYLVFRYGERIYLTRQNVSNAKHGFDQYRVLLKFKGDTLTGYQVSPLVTGEALGKIAQISLDDGISFAEIPGTLCLSKDDDIAKCLQGLRSHLGYQLVSQKVNLPADLKSGEALKASFTFLNLGSAAALKPSRYLDKDRASSYKVQLELRDQQGKPVVLSLHTPTIPTNRWAAGKPVSWQEDLKMPRLAPGQYSVWISLVDPDSKRKLNVLNATGTKDPQLGFEFSAGSVRVTQ